MEQDKSKQKPLQEYRESDDNKLVRVHQGYIPFVFKSKRECIINKTDSPPIGTQNIQQKKGCYNMSSCFDKYNINPLWYQSSKLLKLYKKTTQMSIFKSTLSRFQDTTIDKKQYNQYTQIKKTCTHPKQQNQKKKVLLLTKTSSPTIPSSIIQYTSNKNTNSTKLNKTELINQPKLKIKNQKQQYNQQCKNSLLTPHKGNKLTHILHRLNQLRQKSEQFVRQQPQKMHAPLMNFSRVRSNQHFKARNSKSIQKEDQLGPGHYNLNLNTIKKFKKNKHEFFGSGEIRFKHTQQQTNAQKENYHNYLQKKMSKILKMPPKLSRGQNKIKNDNRHLQSIVNLGALNQFGYSKLSNKHDLSVYSKQQSKQIGKISKIQQQNQKQGKINIKLEKTINNSYDINNVEASPINNSYTEIQQTDGQQYYLTPGPWVY